jgi:hypothetical protein
MSKNIPVNIVQKSMPAEIWVRFQEVCVLRRVVEVPGISAPRKSAVAENIGVPLA